MFMSLNYIPYPSKSIKEDLFSRVGTANEWSFTPFKGMHNLLEKYLGTGVSIVNMKGFLEYIQDFDVTKVRPTEDDAESRSELSFRDITDYYTHLEDIDPSYITRWANQQLYGYKCNQGGLREEERETQDLYVYKDSESDSYVSEADLIEKEDGGSTDSVIKAKTELPYLLRVIHQASLELGGSILSAIIACEKCKKYQEYNPRYIPKPSDLVSGGIWRMSSDGQFLSKYEISDNTSEKFRIIQEIVRLPSKDDGYDSIRRAYKRLMEVLTILDIDITEEDATEFDSNYINRMTCSYLASNEEYIENFGFVDVNIQNALKPEFLLKKLKDLRSEELEEDAPLSLQEQLEQLDINYQAFLKKRRERTNSKASMLIRAFFERVSYNERMSVDKVLLKRNNGNYYTCDVGKLHLDDGYEFNTSNKLVAAISSNGYLIINIKDSNKIAIASIEDALNKLNGATSEVRWSDVNL